MNAWTIAYVVIMVIVIVICWTIIIRDEYRLRKKTNPALKIIKSGKVRKPGQCPECSSSILQASISHYERPYGFMKRKTADVFVYRCYCGCEYEETFK